MEVEVSYSSNGFRVSIRWLAGVAGGGGHGMARKSLESVSLERGVNRGFAVGHEAGD